MTVSQEQACEVLRAHLRREGMRFEAVPVPGTLLWIVRAYETEPRPGVAGPTYVVGPDRKLWTFSADPQIHDLDAAVDALTRLYAERLAGHVDPDRLAERVREITEQRRALADGLISDARAGALKAQRRILP